MTIAPLLRDVLVLITCFSIYACGSSDSASPETETVVTADTKLHEDVVLPDASTASSILPQESFSSETVISVPSGTAVNVGSVFHVPAGSNERFPFGISGRVESVTNNTDGSDSVALSPVRYSDIVQESSSEIVLDMSAAEIIGIVAPEAVQPSDRAELNAIGADYSFRNGAITVTLDKENKYSQVRSLGITGADTQVNANIDLLSTDGIEASTFRPVDLSGELSLVVEGGIDDLSVRLDHDFNILNPTNFKLDVSTEGEMGLGIELRGEASLRFGFFSQAWKEVEDQALKLFGVKANLIGLPSEDKIGQYPLGGIVLAVPGVTPVVQGVTQTSVRLAKPLGVIVWVYLTTSGEVVAEGSLTPLNLFPSRFQTGVNNNGGDFEFVSSFDRLNTQENHLEVLQFDGSLSGEMRLGASFELDFFMAGVRTTNVGLFAGSQLAAELTGRGGLNIPDLSQPGQWEDGTVCSQGQIGVGFQLGAKVLFGVELETAWTDFSGLFEYETQYPAEENIFSPGRTGPWWSDTFLESGDCNPEQEPVEGVSPEVDDVFPRTIPADESVSFTLTGSNLPNTISVGLGQSGNCTVSEYATEQVMVTCPATAAGTSDLIVSDGVSSTALSGTPIAITVEDSEDSTPVVTPAVTQVDPLTTTVGQDQTFTLTGSNLPTTIEVGLDQAGNCTVLDHSLGEVVVTCPSFTTPGTLNLLVTDGVTASSIQGSDVSITVLADSSNGENIELTLITASEEHIASEPLYSDSSQNGRYVLFKLSSSRELYHQDVITGVRKFVTSNVISANISGDGNKVVILSGDLRVYLWDSSDESITLVSHAYNDTTRVANGDSVEQLIDFDGSDIFYRSEATNLVSDTSIFESNLYHYSVQEGKNTRLNNLRDSAISDDQIYLDHLTPDGRYVFYQKKDHVLNRIVTMRYDMESGEMIHIGFSVTTPGVVGSSADGNLVLTSGREQGVWLARLYNLLTSSFKDLGDRDSRPTGIDISEDGRYSLLKTSSESSDLVLSNNFYTGYYLYDSQLDKFYESKEGLEIFRMDSISGDGETVFYRINDSTRGGRELYAISRQEMFGH